MCTVTYIPKQDGFILTSNRDELASRQTLAPAIYPQNGQTLLYPKDTVASGTWIAMSEQGSVACLLNGAFGKHKRQLPYRKSRGLVVLESFDFKNIDEFTQKVDLDNIEPFTLLLISSAPLELVELKWDGQQKHVQRKNTDATHIWSSATLYPPAVAQKKEKWFREYIAQHQTAEDMMAFHQSKLSDDPKENVCADFGNGLKTISITQIIVNEDQNELKYKDLVHPIKK